MIQRRALAGAVAFIGLVGSARLAAAARPEDAKYFIYTGPATRWPALEEYIPAPNILSDLTTAGGEVALLRSWIPDMTVGEEVSVRLSDQFNHSGVPGIMRVRRVK